MKNQKNRLLAETTEGLGITISKINEKMKI